MRQSYLRRDPAHALKLPLLPEQPPKAVLPKDLEHFLAATRHDPLEYALISFLADTGCRIGGLVNLRLAELNLEAGSALVHEKGRGGQPQVRTVYMKPRTVEALRAYLEVHPLAASQPVFWGQRGPLTGSGIFQRLKRVAVEAGIPGALIHMPFDMDLSETPCKTEQT